ncbi:hypothetical protein [Nocardia thraciensis]
MIELSAAGDDFEGSYAVCDRRGRPVVCRRFHDEDRLYQPGEPSTAHLSAAEKAIWLAGKARASAGIDAGVAVVHAASAFVDGDVLSPLAHIAMELDIQPDNPAVACCRANRAVDWHTVELARLISWRPVRPVDFCQLVRTALCPGVVDGVCGSW